MCLVVWHDKQNTQYYGCSESGADLGLLAGGGFQSVIVNCRPT